MHVYVVTNKVNGKIYVGQTVSDLERYFRSDVTRALRRCTDRKPHFYNAIRKHGSKNFSIRLLVDALDKDQADKLEQFFIRTLGTQNRDIGYNIAAGGGGSFGYKRTISPEHRAKLAAAGRGRTHSSETKEKMRLAGLGKSKSVEHRKNLSRARLGKKIGPFSDEHRRRMSEAASAAHARRKAACQNLS